MSHNNLLDIQSTAAYIKACAGQADLDVRYDKHSKQAYATGMEIVLPEMNVVATREDLSKLRSFVASVVANKLYSGTALEDAGYSYQGEDAALASMYNAVEGTRVQRIAAAQYAGDRVALTEGHRLTVEQTAQTLDQCSPEEMSKVSSLLATSVIAENARADFDPYGSTNSDLLLNNADEATKDLLQKAKDAGLIDKVAEVQSSEESLEIAKQIYQLLEGNPPPPPQGGGDGEGEGDAEGEAGKALSGLMKHLQSDEEGEAPKDLEMEYTKPSGKFRPCQDFEVVRSYLGETASNARGRPALGEGAVTQQLTKSRALSNAVRRLFQVKAHKFYRGGLKSGKLHGRNLARAAFPSESYSQRVFRKKQENDTLDTAVELVVDFSGSMHGRRLDTACAGAGLLSSTLTTLGMPNEVIGFTERRGKCIQYIIKPFELRMQEGDVVQSFKKASHLLYQNNDGDSLLWAYNRLKRRPEKRKIMVVLSDGAPSCDRAGDSYTYLQEVVKQIESEGLVEIVGIGIETRSVEEFYPVNYIVNDTKGLPAAILNTIKRKII